MSQQWYYTSNGRKNGPVSSKQLRAPCADGSIQAADLVWTEGIKEWRQARTIKGLFPQAADSPQPTPPPLPPRDPPAPDRSQESTVGASDRIEQLAVSDAWKRRFRAIEADPTKVGFNFWAFFFGPFYYAAKGLWKKGVILTVAGVLIGTLIEIVASVFGWTLPTRGLGPLAGLICAAYANRDIYRKEVFGEYFWPQLKQIEAGPRIVASAVAVFVMSIAVSATLEPGPTLPEVDSPEVVSLAETALRNNPNLKLVGVFTGPLKISDPAEVSYDPKKPKRIARALLNSDLGQEVIFYSVEWHHRDRGVIWVQIQNHE